MNREFLMLAHDYDPHKHHVCDWFVSEKLDGMRAFWDGGYTRGIPCSDVPFANVEKHSRFKIPPVSTGLWTRYAQPIQAPRWFLDHLPKNVPLDGELWAGHGNHQDVTSICKSQIPGEGWSKISYMVFEIPTLNQVLADGRINNPNMRKVFSGLTGNLAHVSSRHFYEVGSLLRKVGLPDSWILKQERLPGNPEACALYLEKRLMEVEAVGGEGLMLRSESSIWEPIRSWKLLKVKTLKDMEGTVIGYKWGEETDKGSKLLGLMGSLRVRLPSGVEFDLSGFTDEERRMECKYAMSENEDRFAVAQQVGIQSPGAIVNHSAIGNPLFQIGCQVSFKYRELTRDGAPKEARYWRKR